MAIVKEPDDEGHQAGFCPMDEQGGQVSEVIGNLTTFKERKEKEVSKEQHTELYDFRKAISLPETLFPHVENVDCNATIECL